MTVTAPKLRRTRPRLPSRGQLRRLEQEISRFIRRRRAPSLRVQTIKRWADDLVIQLRARWILLRAATTGPRQRLALGARSLRRTLNPQSQPRPAKLHAKPIEAPADVPAAMPTGPVIRSNAANPLESVVLWLCCIFVAVGVVLLIAAGRQIREIVKDVENSHAQIRVLQERIAKLEKDAQTLRTASESAARTPVVTKTALSLSRDEVKIVRQFIKVLPSQSAAPMTIEAGQPLGTMSTAPLPEAIIEQIPRLAGARFSIDSSGAIIISGAGSNRVDAIVTYAN